MVNGITNGNTVALGNANTSSGDILQLILGLPPHKRTVQWKINLANRRWRILTRLSCISASQTWQNCKASQKPCFFFGFTPLWDHSNRMFSCFNLGGMGLHTSICASRIASLTSWHALPHVQHNPFSGVHGELFKGSWEAILPCYGQIELWDLTLMKGCVRLDIT